MKICVQIPCQLDQGETQTQCLKYVGVTNIFLRFLYAIGEKMLHFLGHDTVGKMMFTKKWLSGNWAPPIFGKNKVPAPIATLRNLNIVQNGKSSKLAGKPACFHFGTVELRFSGPLFFFSKETNFIIRDILLK